MSYFLLVNGNIFITCGEKKEKTIKLFFTNSKCWWHGGGHIFIYKTQKYCRSWLTTCTAWLLGYTPPLPVQPETEELIAEGVFFTSLTQRCPVQCQVVSALSGLL